MIWISISLLATGLLVITTLSVLFWKSTRLINNRNSYLNIPTLLILALWFITAVFGSISNISPLWFPLFILTPVATILIASNRPYLKFIISNSSPHSFVRIQIYRLVGVVFVIAYLQFGLLSKGFILIAALGDIITGLMAIVLGFIIPYTHPKWRSLTIAFNIFGIMDLILAPISGFLFGASGIVTFPINIVPLFLGPAFGISVHILSLKNILNNTSK